MKGFTRRCERWLAPGLVAGLGGIATLVLVVNSASGSPSNGQAAADGRSLLSRPAVSAAPWSVATAPAVAEPARGPYEFIWPADGRVSQGMTPKHPSGIDVGVFTGSEVRAVRDGAVFFAGGDPCCSYGNFIVIGHDEGWSSVYGHLSIFLVKAGDQVKQGQVIALSGETGHLDGPHLHFELRSEGRPVDPLDYLLPARSAPPYVPDTPVPSPTPKPPPGPDLQPGEATMLAMEWMSQNSSYAYTIDAGTCYALEQEINWLVTCEGSLEGCAGAACAVYLSACVLEQPRLIAKFCP